MNGQRESPNENDIFRGVGIEILLREPKDFLRIKETLTRIGVPAEKSEKKTLFQSCHILHKRGRYVILHFKELFQLDGKQTDMSENDEARRNAIAFLLSQWGLCSLVAPEKVKVRVAQDQIKILSFKEKDEWTLVSKYSIGKRKSSK